MIGQWLQKVRNEWRRTGAVALCTLLAVVLVGHSNEAIGQSPPATFVRAPNPVPCQAGVSDQFSLTASATEDAVVSLLVQYTFLNAYAVSTKGNTTTVNLRFPDIDPPLVPLSCYLIPIGALSAGANTVSLIFSSVSPTIPSAIGPSLSITVNPRASAVNAGSKALTLVLALLVALVAYSRTPRKHFL
jgi:hypothetical protein